MADGNYAETVGVLVLAGAFFVGAYVLDGTVVSVVLALVGLAVLGLWVLSYVVAGMADSRPD